MRALALLAMTLVACSEHRPRISPDVSTRDIAITVRLDSMTPGRLVASVNGPGGDVILLPPDRLLLVQGTRVWPMLHVATGAYVTDLGATNGSFALRLERTSDETALASFVVPPAFVVSAPSTMSRATGMTFSWDGQIAGGQVSFSMTGPCITPFTRVLGSDTGTYGINPGEVQSAMSDTCDVTLAITRSLASGDTSSTLSRFSAEFKVTSTVTFTSTP